MRAQSERITSMNAIRRHNMQKRKTPQTIELFETETPSREATRASRSPKSNAPLHGWVVVKANDGSKKVVRVSGVFQSHEAAADYAALARGMGQQVDIIRA